MGKVAANEMSSRKGNGLKLPSAMRCSPSASLTLSSSPARGGAFWCGANTAYSAVPLRGAIVSMGLRGSPGGLRGEIEIFPGPLAKKDYKVTWISFVCLTPSVYSLTLIASSLKEGAFGCSIQTLTLSLPVEGGGCECNEQTEGVKRKSLFSVVATTQSIAKPSPGWNKVALLTAVCNSPCSCLFGEPFTSISTIIKRKRHKPLP